MDARGTLAGSGELLICSLRADQIIERARAARGISTPAGGGAARWMKNSSFNHSALLYTALGQTFPRASLTKSQQEKEDEQAYDQCLRGLCALLIVGSCAVPSSAQMTEVKQKPPMYSYIANWQIPRAHWAEMAAANADDKAILDKAMADGAIGGLWVTISTWCTHPTDGRTTTGGRPCRWRHRESAGPAYFVRQLDHLGARHCTRHYDSIFREPLLQLEAGGGLQGRLRPRVGIQAEGRRADDAVDMLSQHLVVPMFEKLLANGTIAEYEIDELAIHTSAPGTFAIVYVTPNSGAWIPCRPQSGIPLRPIAVWRSLRFIVEEKGHRVNWGKGTGSSSRFLTSILGYASGGPRCAARASL